MADYILDGRSGASARLQPFLPTSDCLATFEHPIIPGGRPRIMTLFMLEALCERWLEKPKLSLDEMAEFLRDEFSVLVSTHTIGRALRPQGWTKKVARRIAKERSADVRDYYLY